MEEPNSDDHPADIGAAAVNPSGCQETHDITQRKTCCFKSNAAPRSKSCQHLIRLMSSSAHGVSDRSTTRHYVQETWEGRYPRWVSLGQREKEKSETRTTDVAREIVGGGRGSSLPPGQLDPRARSNHARSHTGTVRESSKEAMPCGELGVRRALTAGRCRLIRLSACASALGRPKKLSMEPLVSIR